MAGVHQLEDLLPEAQGQAPMCPPNELLYQFRLGWREFCLRSLAWRPLLVFREADYPNAQAINLNPKIPGGANLFEIVEVRIKSTSDTNVFNPGSLVHPSLWRLTRDVDAPVLTLAWIMQSDSGRELRVLPSLVPSQDALDPAVDQSFFQRWNRAILAWGLARVLEQRNRPWFDPVKQDVWQKEFNNLVSDAKRVARQAMPDANNLDGVTA